MARKRTNWIQHWRKFKGLTAAKLVERLAAYAEMHGVDLPTTTASLSRIEGGIQNFSIDFLQAVADVLATGENDPTTGDLLTRNPFAGTLEVMRALDGLDARQQRLALSVIQGVLAEDQQSYRSDDTTE